MQNSKYYISIILALTFIFSCNKAKFPIISSDPNNPGWHELSVNKGSTNDFHFINICFVNSNDGFALRIDSLDPQTQQSQNQIYIYKTNNGGKDWDIIQSNFETNVIHYSNKLIDWTLNYIEFKMFDKLNGIIILHDWPSNNLEPVTLYTTTNGGIDWLNKNNSNIYLDFKWIDCIDQNHIYTIVINDSPLMNYDSYSRYFILNSIDGGKNWDYFKTFVLIKEFTRDNAVNKVMYIKALDEDNILVFYYNCQSNSLNVIRTSDGGKSWESNFLIGNYTLNPISNDNQQFLSDMDINIPLKNVGYLSNGKELYKSTDLFQSCKKIDLENKIGKADIRFVHFTSENEGWIFSKKIDDNPNYTHKGNIFYTNNGGDSWIEQYFQLNFVLDLKSIYFLDNKQAWFCTEYGACYTKSGGF